MYALILIFLFTMIQAGLNVLIIGSGGREHALAWKMAQSSLVEKIFVAPGNPGCMQEPKTQNVTIAPTNIQALCEFAQAKKIDLTVVGPEIPLALGIVDEFSKRKLRCFGPTQQAARLESSKIFAKEFMQRHNIPTAYYQVFDDYAQACAYINNQSLPLVIKCDGLAAGKGVIIAHTHQEAENAAHKMLVEKLFGDAGKRILIEEFITGEEATFIVISDGKTFLPLVTTQDHKQRDTGDQGPNTGGMGAYSPALIITPVLHEQLMNTVIQPTIDGMAAQNTPFVGFLYAGLMITPDNHVKVLEYNCRLGDPEAQVILTRMQGDLVELCFSALEGRLDGQTIAWDMHPALTVILTSGGYPESYVIGKDIQLPEIHDAVKIFHAGTAFKNNKLITAGGRVLCVTAQADTIRSAQQHVYNAIKEISFEDMHYRTDIGNRAMKN